METLAIIGHGSQAKAWSENLRDSGSPPVVFVRQKKRAGTRPLGPALQDFRQFALLTPDHTHLDILQEQADNLPSGAQIILAHGQSFVKERLKERFARLNFSLLAPKAIASEVRRSYLAKAPLGACYSVEGVTDGPSKQRDFLLRLARDLGINRGPFETSFLSETRADLFSEQSLLCSTLPYLALYSYKILRDKGHSREVAFMECWLELKLIANTLVNEGPQKFFNLISPAALIGGEKAQKLLLDQGFLDKLDTLYQDIQTGTFFDQLDQSDPQQTKQKTLDFWRDQELSQTFQEWKT